MSLVLEHPFFWSLISLIVSFYLVELVSRRRKRQKLLPPGPPRLPFIGNAHELESSHSWLYYTKLARDYGDVISVEALGQPIVTLNTFEACSDLLTKKSAVYQVRPHLVMSGELVGWSKGIGLAEGPRWQMYRKLTSQFLGPTPVQAYYSLVEKEARSLALRMLSDSDTFIEEFKFGLARTVLDMAYGIPIEDKHNIIMKAADRTVIAFGESVEPGKWLVDTFPILKYVPSWFPFAEFKRTAKMWRKDTEDSIDLPFETVKTHMTAGTAKPSFTSRAMDNPPVGATEDIIKWAAGTLYLGAIDTNVSTITTFVLNMVLHPEVQEKARAEIERVIGKERLPTLADRPNLPYIDQILKETLRVHPAVPMGLPYRALQDVGYRGSVIPKDAIVMGNIWAISRDPKAYPEPTKFIPERFEESDLLDPRQYVFGFGRRICPGQYLADGILWITMATMLATFNFRKARDSEGREITPSVGYTGGMVCEPLPFVYEVSPRSDDAAALVQEANTEL